MKDLITQELSAPANTLTSFLPDNAPGGPRNALKIHDIGVVQEMCRSTDPATGKDTITIEGKPSHTRIVAIAAGEEEEVETWSASDPLQGGCNIDIDALCLAADRNRRKYQRLKM